MANPENRVSHRNARRLAGLRAEMGDGFASIRAELRDIREPKALEEAARNSARLTKEIDHLMERVRAIEKMSASSRRSLPSRQHQRRGERPKWPHLRAVFPDVQGKDAAMTAGLKLFFLFALWLFIGTPPQRTLPIKNIPKYRKHGKAVLPSGLRNTFQR